MTTPRAIRIAARVYENDEPTNQMEALGVVSLENGKMAQRPTLGKAADLAQFIKNYRDYGVGPEQSDAEFLTQLPQRVSWRDGLAEEIKED